MIRQAFTQAQVKELLKNKNVENFTGTYLTYTPKFKIRAVSQYRQGLRPREIFRRAGFNIMIIGKDKPCYLIYDWLKIFKTRGAAGLKTSLRGKTGSGRPKGIGHLSDAEKIKRLKLEIRYLRKENDFLGRLRARKAE